MPNEYATSWQFNLTHNLKDRPLEGLTRPTEANEWGAKMANRLKRDFDCLGIDLNAFYPGEPHLKSLDILQSAPEVSEYQVFFYHSDHLGSSSFITDVNGDATQHLQYLPFGEDLVHEQNTAAYLSPYTFSGKERDVETNLSYFGARYYEASLSIWLSVDPMAHKYPHQSPYTYCSNNPVILFDPDGKEDYEVNSLGYLKVVKSTIGNGQPDRLIAGKARYDKKTGELTNNPEKVLTLGKGSITGNLEQVEGKNYRMDNGQNVRSDMTKISLLNNEDADKLFNFLSENTRVEIGHLKTTIQSENGITESNTIATNHSEKHEYELAGKVSKTLNNKSPGLLDITYKHSHPFPDSFFGQPSPPDEAAFLKWRSHPNAGNTKLNFLIKYRGQTNSF
jgi:RHS repeat-associated protein